MNVELVTEKLARLMHTVKTNASVFLRREDSHLWLVRGWAGLREDRHKYPSGTQPPAPTGAFGKALVNSAALSRKTISRSSTCMPAAAMAIRARMA